uniref:Chlorophyllase n=1 Tax=Aegilops tauschii subsp. strangulata TaxID=200361 RepID=A0A453NH86_AEGTS
AAAPAETMNKSAAGAEVPEAFTSVFQPGKLAVEAIQVDENAAPTPPIPVLIVAPKDAGTYPVAMLLHGFFLHNHFYEHLLRHVASHGFIIVAPQILTYEPSSFGMAMPVLVIGTGLGEEKKNIFFPPCAPKDVNHAEFYRECRPPCYYFVTKDYGHLDMLDDDAPKFITCVCKDGNGCKGKMRRCVAGIMVAFLNAALGEKDADLEAILRDPAVAPTTLDPVEHRVA